MSYHPLEKFDINTIVLLKMTPILPNQLLRGMCTIQELPCKMVLVDVRLIFNANDLAKLIQMYLSDCEYAGKRYIEEKTIEEFTSCQYRRKDNRRGIGFDKPVIDDTDGPTYDKLTI